MLNKLLKKIDYEIRKIPHVKIYSPNQIINAKRRNVNVNWLETAYTIYLSKAFLLGLVDQAHGRPDSIPMISLGQEEQAFFEAGALEFWCEKNITGIWIKYEEAESHIFAFENFDDATSFKMII